ncbi:MAG: type II 3-dehydroquinate dehydratase [Bacteroidales bacterium]|nr:type II 3-dehydroquinate dehydratase [Bacteroidales bacterium]
MKLIIINGPNLNLLGSREPDVYGNRSFEDYLKSLRCIYEKVGIVIEYFQSNIEGELIDKLQDVDGKVDGIIMNPGGYSHTSVAIMDAIAAINTPVVEVHISNINAREEYRRISLTASRCRGMICGFGLSSYELAVKSFLFS